VIREVAVNLKRIGIPFARRLSASQKTGWPVLFLLVLVSSALFNACVTYIPVDEYNLARAAYESARDADAPKYAPALWFQAEQTYREGQKLYKDRAYGQARSSFNQARSLAEQAENMARLERHKSGDFVP
jgi:hypothetical protein